MPEWYKSWCLANPEDLNWGFRHPTPEYLYGACKARNRLLKIFNNKIWFCLVDQERTIRKCIDLLNDVDSAYKLTRKTSAKREEALIQRYVSIGVFNKKNN